jgi:cob(I)alamin adenosyltransferase
MRIYTRGGDEGETSLGSGERVSKACQRVRAYGEVDELLSYLGVLRTLQPSTEMDVLLRGLQEDLMTLASDLATPAGGREPRRLVRITLAQVQRLEELIDTHEADLPRLRSFILPAGTALGAGLLHARTLARRAEREVVALGSEDAPGEAVPAYLNRLSDLLFVLGRWVNHAAGVAEEPWPPPAV